MKRTLELLSYLMVALLASSAALGKSGWVVGDGVDLYGTFWFYWWMYYRWFICFY